MNKVLKGFLITFLVIMIFLIGGGYISYLLAGGNTCTECSGWGVIIFIFIGVPSSVIISIIVGLVLYFTKNQRLGLGIMIAPFAAVLLLIIVFALLVFLENYTNLLSSVRFFTLIM